MFTKTSTLLLCLLSCLVEAAAQRPDPRSAAETLASQEFLVPVHRQDGDPARPAWTGGPGFKAKFETGITFYPRVPADAEGHLPLSWQTEAVRVGETDLIDGQEARETHGEHRFEIHRGNVVEAYDVGPGGIEQSFTLQEQPEVQGDVVVVGRVDTGLSARLIERQCAPISFVDARGRAIVEYGRAIAFDAAGRRTQVETSYDGRRIELRLAGWWLVDAVFPVTIDPLLAPKVVAGGAVGSVHIAELDIGRESENSKRNTLVAFTRHSVVGSSVQTDCYALLCDQDFSNPTLVFADIAAGNKNRVKRPSVAPVGGSDRWVLAYVRDSAVRYHIRQFASIAFSGAIATLPNQRDEFAWSVDVGGTQSHSSNGRALLATRVQNTSTLKLHVTGVMLDTITGLAGRPIRVSLPEAPGFGPPRVSVNQVSSGGAASWIVAWEDLMGERIGFTRITYTGIVLTPFLLTNIKVSSLGSIAGRDGRYMLTYNEKPGTRSSIRLVRFDWPEQASVPSGLVLSTANPRFPDDEIALGLAFDSKTRSHWTLLYRRWNSTLAEIVVGRVAGDGAVLERVVVTQEPTSGNLEAGGITDLENSSCFPLAYGVKLRGSNPVHGRLFCYYPNIKNVLYGTGCKGRISANLPPLPGTQPFRIELAAAPPNVLGFLMIGLDRDSLDLSPLGMKGCYMNQKLTVLNLLAVTSSRGEAGFTLPLPSNLTLNFYSQWLFQDPGSSRPLKFATTAGLASTVK